MGEQKMTDDETQTGHYEEHFRTTRWSLISDVRDPCSTRAQTILNSLLADYWKPIYCHIRKKGKSNEQAKDLTQDFFYSVLYEKDLFAKARRSKGRFRSYLLTALDRYLISEHRRQTAQKRSIHKEIIDTEQLERLEVPGSLGTMTDQQSFDYTWIATLIENVSAHVYEHYCSKGKELYWTIFDRRVKQPIIERTDPPALSQLCAEYGIEDEVVASNMINTVKRSFRKTLLTRIREYVYTDSDVSEELADFFNFLQKKRRMSTEIA